jgi:hypothetical protein
MMGMTFAAFTLMGRCLAGTLHHAAADDALSVLQRNLALAFAEAESTLRNHRDEKDEQNEMRELRLALAAANVAEKLAERGRCAPAIIPAKMISEVPLPIPRSVMSSPIHMSRYRAGGDGQNRHRGEARAGATQGSACLCCPVSASKCKRSDVDSDTICLQARRASTVP